MPAPRISPACRSAATASSPSPSPVALSALAGLLLAARLGSVQHTMGEALLLPAYAAVFVGTTASRSGTPNIGGTFLGVAITGVIVNGLTIVGAEPFVQKIVTGAIIIAAVLVRRFGMVRP